MMEFFKENPEALMNALPTPTGSDNGSISSARDQSILD